MVMRLSALGSVLTKNFKKSQNYCVEKPSQKLKANTELLSWCLGSAPRSPHKTSLTWNVGSDSHKYSNHSSLVADLYLLSLTHTCKSPKEVLFGVWMFMCLSTLTQLNQFSNRGNPSSLSINRDYCAIENNDFISRGFKDWCSNCWLSLFTSLARWCWMALGGVALGHFEEPGMDFAKCFLNPVSRFFYLLSHFVVNNHNSCLIISSQNHDSE